MLFSPWDFPLLGNNCLCTLIAKVVENVFGYYKFLAEQFEGEKLHISPSEKLESLIYNYFDFLVVIF